MDRQKVIILEPCRFDVGPAERHGVPTYLFNEAIKYPPFRTDGFGRAVARRLDEVGFDVRRDFVVIAGAIAMIVAVTSQVAAEYGAFNALVWDGEEYVVVTMGAVANPVAH